VLLAVMAILRKPLAPTAIPQTFLLGLFQTAGVYGFANWALVSGGAGKTAILVYTMPFWVLLFAWIFLKERVKGIQWIAIALGLVGLYFLLEPQALQGTPQSKLLAMLAGSSWAGGVIVAKKLWQSQSVDPLSLTAWHSILGAIPLSIVALSVHPAPIIWSPPFIGALLYNVICGTAIAQFLWLYVLNNLPAGTAGLGTLLNPVLGIVFASLQLGERPNRSEFIGILIIVTALSLNVMQEIGRRKHEGERM